MMKIPTLRMQIVGWLLALAMGAAAAEPLVIKLWPDHADKQATENARPDRGDGVRRITGIEVPTMAVYPAARETPGPAVLVFPGGSYSILAINKEGTEIAEWLKRIGITAVVVKYRVPGKREEAFKDGQRAIRLLRQHAVEWRIDPRRIGVLGFSAGGHLSARLSTDFGQRADPPADAADALDGRPDFCVLIYPAYLADNKSGKLAKELPLSDRVPPTFIVQTKDDTGFVAGTQLYHDALKAVGVPSTFHLYEKGGHGYGMRPSKHEVSKWPVICEAWFKQLGVK